MRRLVLLGLLTFAACGDGTSGGLDAGNLGDDDADLPPDADIILHSPDTGPVVHRDAGAPPTNILIYAHTDLTLFQGDPATQPLVLKKVGDFDCIGSGAGKSSTSMTDVAVNKDGRIYGVSGAAVYILDIQGTTIHCATIWPLKSAGQFYGLTFAPAGVLGADETLVAADSAGKLWAIDDQGVATQVGSFGVVPKDDGHGHTYKNSGKAWELSGDIVFLTNGGNWVGFATLRDCPNPPSSTSCNSVDTLVEIDVGKLKSGNTATVTKAVRGQVVKGAGCADANAGYGSMYGIAAWNDKVFGFSRAGNLVEISNTDGSACLVQTYAGDKFAGAGVTTLAPVIGPN